ncbi:hypothetical protein LOK49_LG03G03862 [Camellia lanceoleosa]|uniref:Uncharacterized protein n=1 Tax=Camellia lanceoleosa TaxID=1840588 RepID=A0ACC0IBV2_9ERIC|nr:hypothetical protein LOK49_LG03G03862 [Camellia lanceoleosa]
MKGTGMNASRSTKTPLKDTLVVNSRKKLVGDVCWPDHRVWDRLFQVHAVNNNNKSLPNLKEKQNQQSEAKKNNEDNVLELMMLLMQQLSQEVLKRVSQANKSNTSKRTSLHL